MDTHTCLLADDGCTYTCIDRDECEVKYSSLLSEGYRNSEFFPNLEDKKGPSFGTLLYFFVPPRLQSKLVVR